MKINKVFVYGTLMTGMSYHHLVKPFIKHLEPAETNGLLYDLPYGYPALVDGSDEVLGEVIELNDVEEALKVLDCLEDYYGEGNPDNLYIRVVREVRTQSNKYEQAYVYLWASPETLNQIGARIKYSWRNRRNRQEGSSD